MDEIAAIQACRAGDVNAFRHVVERHQARALAHARLLTRNDADAADATQEAFVDAFRNLAKFDETRSFYGWFYVLLRNRCLKQRSRRGTRWEGTAGELPVGIEAPRSDEHLDLWRAIERLEPEHAELIVLKHIEGWSYDELAKAQGIPRGTVMSRLYEARRRLQAALAGVMK